MTMKPEDLPNEFYSAELLRAVYQDRIKNFDTDLEFVADLGLDADAVDDVASAMILCKYLYERAVRPLDTDVNIPFSQYAMWHWVREELVNTEWDDMPFAQMRDAFTQCANKGMDGMNDTVYEVSMAFSNYLDALESAIPEWAVGSCSCLENTDGFQGAWEEEADHQITDFGDLVHVNEAKGEAYIEIPLCRPSLVLAVTWETDDDENN